MRMSIKQKLSYKPRNVKMLAQFSMGMFGIFFFALALLLDEPTDNSLVSIAESTEVKSTTANTEESEQTWRSY